MKPYDPLDYTNLAKNIVRALLDSPEHPMPPELPFTGAGVYAIHYRGDFSAYSRIVEMQSQPPIYVGKAVQQGARKGGTRQTAGSELYQRLRQHANSIEAAENLRIEDFTCRYLVVVPVWITLAERFLIEHYRPVWSVKIDGFGNHDPGKGRRAMRRPQWDVLHPGRHWAAQLRAEESAEELQQAVIDFLEGSSDSI